MARGDQRRALSEAGPGGSCARRAAVELRLWPESTLLDLGGWRARGAARLPVAARRDDGLCLFGRDCKADADIAAGGRIDGGVAADDIARQIAHRTAGVALVDRRVGLDIAVVKIGRASCREGG